MNTKCKDRVKAEWKSRSKDLKSLLNAENNETEDLGSLFDYGLSLDVVKAGTFKDQRENYIRYQFSWGGPSDELRIYENGDIEYWFLDWFDGACINISHDEVAQSIVDFILCGETVTGYIQTRGE